MNTENTSDLQSVIDWLGFTTADAKYKALVLVTEDVTLSALLSDAMFAGELSKIEGEIFAIDAADVPALYWAYERYLNLIGDGGGSAFIEFTDQERLDHALYLGERFWCFNRAVLFMASVCGLPLKKCEGWVAKILAAEARWRAVR